MARPQFKIKNKHFACPVFRGALTVFENKSYGWHYTGDEIEESDVQYETVVNGNVSESGRLKTTATTRRKSKLTRHQYFVRVDPYTDNIAFRIVEGIGRFFSFFRRHSILLLILSALCSIGIDNGEFTTNSVFFLAFTQIFVWVISIVMAFIGRGLRKSKELDETLEKNLLEAGVTAANAQHLAYND